MNNNSLISTIIIFLNCEQFLSEAIESVFNQTYQNWELLLVDDGSTDGSTAIAQKYAAQHPDKVRYLEHESHENRGMSATRNLGISYAQGDYISLLDADDVWLPQKLERQVAILESQPEVGIVFGPTEYWYSWTGKAEDQKRDVLREIGVQSDTVFQPPKLLSLLLTNEANAPATCSVLFRRQVFTETGGFEESFKGLFEDRAFFSKVYLKIPAFVMSECWDRYRQHPDSNCHLEEKTGKYKPYRRSEAHFKFLKWLEGYLFEQVVKDPDVWQALNIGLLPYRNLTLHYLYQIKKRLQIIGQRILPTPIRRWLQA
ncbi:glycosyltransferase family 2 protein [Cylindrospermum sp. FACHB-282]|uniref:glycosyltransferase family 2 protein n=1 Tax=Cylindrospermum sp. FACHB-282 TaxID=2692794 RepID=UPI001685C0BB|nr:glycosyltransferase family 2 protein [Cylindrospermum sp. FACHB-282]MBD2387218.1 glycosyltransferase family 2 protein [Cylindrospermum sp. FACHB-282]